MPFEEGVSGNPNGRPKKAKLIRDALIVELKSRDAGDDPKGVRKIVAKIVDLAEAGERWAAEFVRDTTDGKPAQAIVGGDEDDNPISIITRVRLLGPDD
jgi:hypothetical protein